MIRATAGTWVNYATTVAFQILFAIHYGSSPSAVGFIVTFGIGVALSGVLVSGVQSTAIPRLLASDGTLSTGSLRFLGFMGLAALAVAAVVAAGAAPTGVVLAPRIGLTPQVIADLVRATAAFVLVQFVAGEISSISLAIGQRVIPTISPALPSLIASIGLLTQLSLDVRWTYGLLVIGSLGQVAFLLASVKRPIRVGVTEIPMMQILAGAMFGVYALLALIPPLERVVAAIHYAPSAAQYDYAVRSLKAAQQIILGGLTLAALGYWSAQARTSLERLRESLPATIVFAAMFLMLACSVAVVSGHTLVAFVYQHGRFAARDTDAVTGLLLLALPGFWSEGLGQILTSALLAAKYNFQLIGIGVGNFIGRSALILGLGAGWGAGGIAVAYSIASVVILAVLLVLLHRWGFLSTNNAPLRAGALVSGGTLATALALLIIGRYSPPIISGVVVVAIFAVLFYGCYPRPTLALLPK